MKNRNLIISLFLILLLALSACASPETAVPTNETAASEPVAIAEVSQNTTTNQVDVQPAAPEQAPAAQAATILSEQQTLIDLYKQVNPSVVSIRVNSSASSTTSLPENHPDVPGSPLDPQNMIPSTIQGSGFIYDAAGHIVTNNHVVADAGDITVVFWDGSEAAATLVGTDPDSDLAVIQLTDADASMIKPVPLGDSDALEVGQFVIAIGNPYGLANSMTTGIVSGLGRMLPTGTTFANGAGFSIPAIIQTDAAINPGNSGGPLLNLAGEVIGINTAIESSSRSFAGIGYAVPSKAISQVIPELIANGRVEHPWLGIRGGTVDSDIIEAMNLSSGQRGVLIAEAIADGPAAKAGLKGGDETVQINGLNLTIGGDIITAIDGQPVLEFDDVLTYIVQDTTVGQTVTMTILRDGQEQNVDVTLEARPAN